MFACYSQLRSEGHLIGFEVPGWDTNNTKCVTITRFEPETTCSTIFWMFYFVNWAYRLLMYLHIFLKHQAIEESTLVKYSRTKIQHTNEYVYNLSEGRMKPPMVMRKTPAMDKEGHR